MCKFCPEVTVYFECVCVCVFGEWVSPRAGMCVFTASQGERRRGNTHAHTHTQTHTHTCPQTYKCKHTCPSYNTLQSSASAILMIKVHRTALPLVSSLRSRVE